MNIKSNVYNFGIVLPEMIKGLQVYNYSRTSDSKNLVLYAKPSLSDKKKLKKIMDSRLGELYPLEGACQAAQLILRCVESDPKNRPSMEQVLEELENINAIQDDNTEAGDKSKSQLAASG
jgi:serine/threonine protein kinase